MFLFVKLGVFIDDFRGYGVECFLIRSIFYVGIKLILEIFVVGNVVECWMFVFYVIYVIVCIVSKLFFVFFVCFRGW